MTDENNVEKRECCAPGTEAELQLQELKMEVERVKMRLGEKRTFLARIKCIHLRSAVLLVR